MYALNRGGVFRSQNQMGDYTLYFLGSKATMQRDITGSGEKQDIYLYDMCISDTQGHNEAGHMPTRSITAQPL